MNQPTDDLTTLLARSRTIAEACDPNAWYDVETLTQSLPLGDDGDAAHIRQASPQAWLALLDFVETTRDAIADDYEPADVLDPRRSHPAYQGDGGTGVSERGTAPRSRREHVHRDQARLQRLRPRTRRRQARGATRCRSGSTAVGRATGMRLRRPAAAEWEHAVTDDTTRRARLTHLMDSWAEEQALMEAVIEAARELAEYHFADVADMGWTGCSPRQEWSDARRRCEDTVTALDDFRRAKKETTDGG